MPAEVASAPGTHEAALGLLADRPPGRVLDTPCGGGQLARRLLAAGHRVVAADLAAKGVDSTLTAVALDLNVALPFRDACFDAVVMIEGIEHLENPWVALRECRRVLGPGGVVVVSTPNILNLRSRAKFATFGTFYWFDESGYRRGLHVNAIPFQELRYVLAEVGFVVDEVRVNRRTVGMRLLGMIVGPALRLAARLGRRSPSLNAMALLSGEVIVVRGRKAEPRP
jgi:SAM-dependent methyltransferase